jgi:gliding motility-associated lipoprotein GldH
MHKLLSILIFAGLVTCLFSCDSKRIYEQNMDIPENIWDQKNPVYFDVPITDTTSLHNIYINIRNASGYGFSNIYLFLDTKYPNNTISRDTIECILADPSGKWLGDGSGDIWDNQILFKKNVRFKQMGTYKFRYEQAMRMPKLPMIMDVGLRIEKQ